MENAEGLEETDHDYRVWNSISTWTFSDMNIFLKWLMSNFSDPLMMSVTSHLDVVCGMQELYHTTKICQHGEVQNIVREYL